MELSVSNQQMHNQIVSAQVSSLYAALPISQVATIINSILIYAIQHSYIERSTANYWLWVTLAIVFLRLSLFVLYSYPKQDHPERDNKIWISLFSITAILAAVVWGSSGLFLFPDNNIQHQVFLVFVIAGMASGSIATLSAERYTAAIFLVVLMTPISVQFITLPEQMSKVMGFMMFFSLILLLLLSARMNRQFIDNISMSIEARSREDELFNYSSILMQTQKIAGISGWEANRDNNTVNLRPEFDSYFEDLVEKKQDIINAIMEACKQSDFFDIELNLASYDEKHSYCLRVIGEVNLNDPRIMYGAIQDITPTKSSLWKLESTQKRAIESQASLSSC